MATDDERETKLARIATLRSEITERLRELLTILGSNVDSDLVEAEHVVSRNCSRAYSAIDSQDAALRRRVVAWLDCGNESTTEHIVQMTGVPLLDVLVVLNDEAQAKRVECVGASRLWRRPAMFGRS